MKIFTILGSKILVIWTSVIFELVLALIQCIKSLSIQVAVELDV